MDLTVILFKHTDRKNVHVSHIKFGKWQYSNKLQLSFARQRIEIKMNHGAKIGLYTKNNYSSRLHYTK